MTIDLSSWFATWQREYRERRAKRRAELETAIRSGKKILHHNGIWPDMALGVFIPSARTPEKLAEHIENREAGFGFVTCIIGPGEESDPAVKEAVARTAHFLAMSYTCTPPEDQ